MKDVCLRIVLGVTLVLYGLSGLLPKELNATEEMYPCEADYGYVVACGQAAEDPGGDCNHVVGTPDCNSTSEQSCSTASDYWCHTDDECGETSNKFATCDTANYPGDTYRWSWDCPGAYTTEGGCACVRVTNPEDIHSLTWDEFLPNGESCD